jgi:TRAP-type mannitol/chloroaromatic compound transport system permease small subunit
MLKLIDSLAATIGSIVFRIGRIFSWALVLLLLAIIVNVVLRYVFSRDMIALAELQWHFYAVLVMISLAYAQKENAHVRVDLIHRHFSPGIKRFVEIFSLLFLLIPLMVFVFIEGLEFTQEAFRLGEKSPAPGGLPMRWIIKAFIPIGAALLIINSVARIIRLSTGSESVDSESNPAD